MSQETNSRNQRLIECVYDGLKVPHTIRKSTNYTIDRKKMFKTNRRKTEQETREGKRGADAPRGLARAPREGQGSGALCLQGPAHSRCSLSKLKFYW